MSAIYYLANLSTNKNYTLGVANNAKISFVEVLNEIGAGDEVILYNEDSHLEEKYGLTIEECHQYMIEYPNVFFEQIDRWFYNEKSNGMNKDKFLDVFEIIQNKQLTTIEIVKMIKST